MNLTLHLFDLRVDTKLSSIHFTCQAPVKFGIKRTLTTQKLVATQFEKFYSRVFYVKSWVFQDTEIAKSDVVVPANQIKDSDPGWTKKCPSILLIPDTLINFWIIIMNVLLATFSPPCLSFL